MPPRKGWQVVESYTDQGISGATLIRPGIQKLLQDAVAGKFDIILTESLERLSRDQEDIAHIHKRMLFEDVRIFTLSDGEVSPLHIGLKGTMGALYLKDLGDKTRRGLVPEGEELRIEIHGELAGILELCQHGKTPGRGRASAEQIKLVAGARNHREFRLPPLPI